MSNRGRVYFPNLDGLRFIGSLAIIIFHTEGIKRIQGIGEPNWVSYYAVNGNHAVSLFFTIVSTIIVSILSYEFFEKYFLKLKKKFTIVESKPV